MIKNQANIYQFVLRDMIGQGMTGLSPTVQIRKDSGTFAVATNAVTEVGYGAYEVALTATECNCDVMMFMVTLPDGQFPAILENERLVATGGATPAEIWQYNGQGGRTVTNTIPSAADNATAVWGAQTKEVTIATAQADTFATASALTTVGNNVSAIKAKTDNLPQNPAAVGSAMTLTEATVTVIRNGLATIAGTDALAQGLYNLTNYGDLNWSTADVSGLSTFDPATDAVTLTDAYDAAKTASQLTTSDLSALATSAEITALASVANDTLAGMLYWRVVDDTLITYGANGSIRGQYTITKDSTGNIVKIEPIPSNDGN